MSEGKNNIRKAKYKHFKITAPYNVIQVISDVVILDENSSSYQIKLCTSDVSNHVYGDTLWVRKDEVIIPVI